MGDRTYAQLRVHRWPKGKKQRAAVEGAIADAFGLDVTSHDDGECYSDDQASAGVIYEVIAGLANQAPTGVYEAHEDPLYEWLGSLWWWHPKLGEYSVDCDANGQPVFPASVVMGAEGKTTGELDQIVGGPWRRKFATFTERANEANGPTADG